MHPEEAKYILQVSNADLLVTILKLEQRAQAIRDAVGGFGAFTFDATQSQYVPRAISFVPDRTKSLINPEKGLVLISTSGSTGPPKGVLLSRRSVTVGLPVQVEVLDCLTSNDTWLDHSPVHWMVGVVILVLCIFIGSCIEVCNAQFSPE